MSCWGSVPTGHAILGLQSPNFTSHVPLDILVSCEAHDGDQVGCWLSASVSLTGSSLATLEVTLMFTCSTAMVACRSCPLATLPEAVLATILQQLERNDKVRPYTQS